MLLPKSHGVALSFLVGWILLAAPLPAQNLEKALKEGEVVWYTPTAIEDSQKMIQAFEKKHPGIKVRLFRNRETALLPRIMAEKQIGQADRRCYFAARHRLLSALEAQSDSTLHLAGKRGLSERVQRSQRILDRPLRYLLRLESSHRADEKPAAQLRRAGAAALPRQDRHGYR